MSAIKWNFVKRFDSIEECLTHRENNRFKSIVTSPHVKGKKNVVLHGADYMDPRLSVMIESLNLGTITVIVLYEITKQRRKYQQKYKRVNRGPKK